MRKPKKKGAVSARVKKMYDKAAGEGEKRFQSDLTAAKAKEANFAKPQEIEQKAHTTRNIRRETYAQNNRRAGYGSTPSKDVMAQKSSGMYNGSVPVAGTGSRKLMRKNNPIKGIKKSEAKASVKKSMIRKMKGAY